MIALYPGAFKPPHRGHFNVVKSLLDGSYSGAIYDKDNYKEKGEDLLGGTNGEKPSIDKVIVFVGAGERNGITKDESMAIWNIYAKHLGNVEIVDGQKNPMFAAKDYAVANKETPSVAITGIRGDADFVDLKRITTFKNAPNVSGLAFSAAPDSKIRATDFRNSILSGNLDKIADFFPPELDREDILLILTDLKDKIVAEIIRDSIGGYMNEYFNINENLEGTEEADIEDATGDKRPQYTEIIGSILEYMLDQKMNITPLPEVKIRYDEDNAKDFFGRTAHYDPNKKEVVVYATGRHPKDICRSFTHEMIHHIQNIEGRLGNIQTSNTNEDEALLELDGTENKTNLGANATLAVSLANAKCFALSKKQSLFRNLGKSYSLPIPLMNIINGGAHADNDLNIQEFMIRPDSAINFMDAIEKCFLVIQSLKKLLQSKKMLTNVGDEGGFAPSINTNEDVYSSLCPKLLAIR